MQFGLLALNKLAGNGALDRLGLRKQVERVVGTATRSGFAAAAAAGRTFSAAKSPGGPVRQEKPAEGGLFDLTPSDEQRMIAETVGELAAEVLRPAAAEADTVTAAPREVLTKVAELGVSAFGVPEALGGISAERSAVTGVLVAEAMAHGDMGLAVAALAPSAVSTALALWGDGDQQATYLPAFVGDNSPAAALAVAEPRPLFDPFSLQTKAYRRGGEFVLSGEKSFVPLAASAELFLIAADIEGRGPALFLVESSASGLSVRPEPGMGIRAAGAGRVRLDKVSVPAAALLGSAASEVYADCVRLSRLGWSALALGTARAVLDYVVPYVNEREAFGEPISNRQGVAFKVADIGIELEGLKLVTYRAAARAEQGLPYAREVALARKLCSDKAMAIGSDGVQLLGGHGFVKEHPVERWYRDLRAVSVMEGGVLV
ncbi:acyl-CoA dehydrogenase family protein [Sciscionella marina]|uniref:acyl-CoA dehydrogenase family protein n=1 Tax=Sciscionella marina TaxID=508770 RepID=UPI00035EC478|nr:acyl-CoA dehydrogenase family protein [Sciscionella marina]